MLRSSFNYNANYYSFFRKHYFVFVLCYLLVIVKLIQLSLYFLVISLVPDETIIDIRLNLFRIIYRTIIRLVIKSFSIRKGCNQKGIVPN